MNRSPRLPVVVGVDGSESSLRALDRAVEEAVLRGAPLEVLCGRPPYRPVPDGEAGEGGEEHRLALFGQSRRIAEQAAERARESAPGLPVELSTPEEPAVAALVHASRRAALTVVGTRGRGGFAGLLLGSVSMRVAAHLEGPLMVVRGGSGPRHHAVVVGVEYETDTDVVRHGLEEARRRSAVLRVLHAWQLPIYPGFLFPPPTRVLEEITEQQARFEQEVPQQALAGLQEAHPEVDVRVEAVYAGPGQVLIEASEAADLVVLAAHRRHRRFGMHLGPVTHAVLHHAHCAVVLVPTG